MIFYSGKEIVIKKSVEWFCYYDICIKIYSSIIIESV